MKCLNKKFFIKLIVLMVISVTLLNCGFNSKVYAEGEKVFGGELLGPIMNLFTGIADGVMDILHSTVLEQDETLIKLDGTADTWWNNHGASVIGWLVGIAIAALILVLAIPSGGISIAAGAGILAKISGVCFIIKAGTLAAIGGTIGGVVVGRVVEASMMADDIYLPVYRLSIQEIFANDIPLLDVNFFNPNKYYDEEVVVNEEYVEAGTKIKGHTFAWDLIKEIRESVHAQASLNIGKRFSIEEARKNEAFKILIDAVNETLPSDQKIEAGKNLTFAISEFDPCSSEDYRRTH